MMSQETFAVIKIIKRSEAQFVFFTLLLVGALISTAWGVRNAILYSQDFQWSPAVLFWKGINPYSTWLEGNVDGAIILSQAPNYHQLLYIIFWPLTLLDFEQAKIVWATINISFALGSLLLLKKICSLSKFQFFVIASIFLMSTPFRNTVGNGQQSLLVLFMFLAYWSSDNIFKGIYLAIGFVKYSFAPIFFLLGLLRKEKSIFVTVSLMIFSGLFFIFI
jgi:hypothetical protein